MKLTSCFEYLGQDDIRLKDTGIRIETILNDYLNGSSAEEITRRYSNLSLDKVYTTITYYLHNRVEVEAYLKARYPDTRQADHHYLSDFELRLQKRIKNPQLTVVAEHRANYHSDPISMELEDYFDFLNEDDIRLKGTRIGIETILDDYFECANPEEIAARYRSLSLEQVYATLAYYWHNKTTVEAYLEAWRQYTDQAYEEQMRNPSEAIKRLHRLKREQMQTDKGTVR